MATKAYCDFWLAATNERDDFDFVAVFEGHVLMPCWECKSIVILTNQEADEITPDWRRELL